MAMFNWTERSGEVLQRGGVIAPDERLPWPQTATTAARFPAPWFELRLHRASASWCSACTATFGAILLYALLSRGRGNGAVGAADGSVVRS